MQRYIYVLVKFIKCIYDKNALSNLNRSIKHKLNDEFEYKQFVTVLTYCFVFRQGLSILERFSQTRNNTLK